MDCDLSYDPEHLGRMLYAIQDSRARIVIASPYTKGGQTTNIPFSRRVMSRGANWLLSRAAGGDLTTVTGMVRVYDGRFLRSLDLRAMDTEINTEIIYKARILHARIVEIPAHLDWSFQGTGGARRAATNFRVTRSTLSSLFSSFLFRPFLFFMLPGLILLAVAAYSFGWCTWHVVQVWGQPSQFGNSGLTGAIQNAYARAPHAFLFTGITLGARDPADQPRGDRGPGQALLRGALPPRDVSIYRRVRPDEGGAGPRTDPVRTEPDVASGEEPLQR